MELLRTHQFNLMLFLGGACAILSCTTIFIKALPQAKKSILAFMELSAMLLLLFDRYSYLYDGDPSELGGVMVRLSNGMVYFLSVMLPHLVTQYLKAMWRESTGVKEPPLSLRICEGLFVLGSLLVVVSQFTGLYYTFDGDNLYHRAPGYLFCYLAPVGMVLLQEGTMLRRRKDMGRRSISALMTAVAIPTCFSLAQIFTYGVSLGNMAMVITVIIFHIFALDELSKSVQEARERELESIREGERRLSAMFEHTAEALASAIDAKDAYTHGHSTRVAALSRQIAREAGYTEEDCGRVYFAGLLHDVGKIGIRDDIIQKVGKLTEEEFAQIKLHPALGFQILSRIREAPSLSIGARYHHERYDGKGYPEGLAGEAIPEMARIIAVADAFDAMNSNRSYRDRLSGEEMRSELLNGMGKQFDPRFAEILLRLLDRGEVAE